MRNRLWLAAGFALAAVLLWLSLRGIHWSIVWTTIQSASPVYVASAVVLGLLPMLLRAARWRTLLRVQGPVSYATVFWAVAAGYFGNNFLPARGGEWVRSCIVRDRSKLALSYVLATALTERVADAVALVIFGFITLAFLPQAGIWMKLMRGTFAIIGAAGLACLIFFPLVALPLNKMLQSWPRWQKAAQQILLGVRSLHNAKRLLPFTVLTVLIWSLDAVSTTLMAHALAINMPVPLAMLLIVSLSLSSALPSTPGYIGVYQFVAVTLLKPFGISPSAAIAFMLVTQAISFAVTGVLGSLAIGLFTPFKTGAIPN